MLEKVKEFVARHNMLEKQDKIIVGVSGGADSICLLFVLMELQKWIPFEMMVVHVNHQLRGEAAKADAAYVEEICRKHHIFCVTYSENIELIAKNRKQSTEEAGRDVRREKFREAMWQYGANKIALAHHKNDNVETFFMNLARGTGLKGMGGIRPVKGEIIRPLLCLERGEIEQYLQEKQITYCVDQTNAGDDYTRNRIRNHVLPYLEQKVNARTVNHVSEAMRQLCQLQDYLHEQMQKAFETCVKEQEGAYVISEAEFSLAENILKPLILREVLVRISGKEKDLEAVHLSDLQALFSKQVGKKLDLPYEMEARRCYEGISVGKRLQCDAKEVCAFVKLEPGEEKEYFLQGQKITCRLKKNEPSKAAYAQKSGTQCFDYDIITQDVCIRTRQPGDYITIHPDGRTQKIKSFFINEKIPAEQRDKLLLVADGSHILWIVGIRTNCAYRVCGHTKRVLEIQMDKGEDYGRDN